MEDDTGTGLPASLAAAWGRRERPAKGPRPALSLDRIVQAAITVAEADGLAAVSMGRVAKELGAGTMALYRYVGAKGELLALMTDAAYGLPPAPDPDLDWRTGLARWARGVLEGYRRHPWLRHVPVESPPILPNQMHWMEDALVALRTTGLTGPEKLSTVMLLAGYVRYWAQVTLDIAAAAGARGVTAEEAMSGYGQRLALLVDAGRFPELHGLIAGDLFAAEQEADPDADFDFGLDRILDGVATLVAQRTGAPA
ncbi:TetR/AcrR family transcriptional regulator [Plantactinospora siamensis]|uniref:TetR/AcrR family transcriptional regulator n=1 Tax=Plantactinospora siamensis TaxID=555372 RepID=A0ABV6P0Z5_9ACTN